MEKLRIDRGLWLAGDAAREWSGSTMRCQSSGTMCCLGLYGVQRGVPQSDMNGHSMPRNVTLMKHGEEFQWLFQRTPKWPNGPSVPVEVIISDANDDEALSNEQREAKIIELFKRHGGIEVEFYGDAEEALRRVREAFPHGQDDEPED